MKSRDCLPILNAGMWFLPVQKKSTNGLSAAIHSKKDADTFMTELKAIRKRAK